MRRRLVVFVGGPRFTMSLNAGPAEQSLFRLGPREPFFPAYRVSSVYVGRVNITHATNINSVNVTNIRYGESTGAGAVCGLCRTGFVNARPVREFGRSECLSARSLAS